MGIFPFWDKLVIHDKFVANFEFLDQRTATLFSFIHIYSYPVPEISNLHSKKSFQERFLQGQKLNEISRGRVLSVHFVCFLVVGQAAQAGQART